jgi:predicted N-acetyltransferase YhbS
MEVHYLAEYRSWIPVIAQWFYDEWGDFYSDLTVRDIIERLEQRTNRDTIPLALVAIEDDAVIGTVSLKQYDMDTRMQYSPWLASLYVEKAHRNKGTAIKLIDAAIDKAVELGVEVLYLYTIIPQHMTFYILRGWKLVETTEYRGRTAVIVKKRLR